MKVAILTSPNQWFCAFAEQMSAELDNAIVYVNHNDIAESYDVVFILSYHKIVEDTFLSKNRHNIVIHASKLPAGRGWSPLFWQILEGKKKITFSMFEATEGVDDGPIYMKQELLLNGHELYEELRVKQALTQIKMCKSFIENYAVPLEKKSTVSGDYDVDLLIVSGVLGNYLQQNPNTKLTAEVLYWEGLTENRIGKNIFFTLGDLYLKECITRYPRAAIAKKCFKEYKDEMTLRFTGSIGTNIPKSKQQELKRLESLLK